MTAVVQILRKQLFFFFFMLRNNVGYPITGCLYLRGKFSCALNLLGLVSAPTILTSACLHVDFVFSLAFVRGSNNAER